MADDFAQTIKGIAKDADTILSTDGLEPIAVKKGTTWVPLEVDSSTGNLSVNVTNSSIDVTGTVAVSGVTGDVAVVNGTTAFTVKDDNLDYSTDNVAIKGSTGSQLVVNSDGSINVAATGAGNDNTYHRNFATLVKATINTVVTRVPAVTEYYKAFSVTGTGLCHWELQVGLTGSEATIMDVWTTPSKPFEYVDIPDAIKVLTTQTIRIRATNSENAASPASDFVGYATLIRNT